MKNHSAVLIAGIGSSHGDDQVGWEMAKQIQNQGTDLVCVRLARTPDDFLNWVEGFRKLVICDACEGAGVAGTYHHWKWPSNQLEKMKWSGTHNLSLPAVLALADQLGRLPASVHIWGVEVEQVLPGHPMSEHVLAGAASVVQTICKELSIPMKTEGTQHA